MSVSRFTVIWVGGLLAPSVFALGYNRGWKQGMTTFEEDRKHEVKLLNSQIALWKWNHDQMAAGKLYPFARSPAKT